MPKPENSAAVSGTSFQSLIPLPTYGNLHTRPVRGWDGIMQGMCHLSRGTIAQSLSMKTNTDMKTPSEAAALIHSRPHLCDLPVAFRNKAPASSTAGPETDDAMRLKPRFIIVIGTFHSNSIRILIRLNPSKAINILLIPASLPLASGGLRCPTDLSGGFDFRPHGPRGLVCISYIFATGLKSSQTKNPPETPKP